MIFIKRGNTAMYFGQGLILSSLEAEGLSYNGDFPANDPVLRSPLPRRVRIEGYIAATAESPEDQLREVTLSRNILSRITSPMGEFILNVDGRIARLSRAETVFKRSAPFSGQSAEHFTVSAVITDGYFTNPSVTSFVQQSVSGFSFPVTGELTAGLMSGSSHIRLRNGGDVPVGFEAELSPLSAVTSFRLECAETAQHITVQKSFIPGDVIRISTLPHSLCIKLVRDGVSEDLTGETELSSELFRLPTGDCTLLVGTDDAYSGTLSFTEAFISF